MVNEGYGRSFFCTYPIILKLLLEEEERHRETPCAHWLKDQNEGGACKRKCLPTGPAVIYKREETIYTGCLGNAEKKGENAEIWQHLNDKVMTPN